jgi:hypothetical protein
MRCLSGRRRSHWATKGFQAPGGAYGDDRQAETKCGGFHCDMVVRMGLTDMTSGCASQLWAHKLRALFGSLINVTATTLSQIRSRHLSVFFLTQTTILAHPQVRSILAFDLPWCVSTASSVRHFPHKRDIPSSPKTAPISQYRLDAIARHADVTLCLASGTLLEVRLSESSIRHPSSDSISGNAFRVPPRRGNLLEIPRFRICMQSR